VLAGLILLIATWPARAQGPMAAVAADRWDAAALLADQYADPVARKLVTYYRLLAPNTASAHEIAAFASANPNWPNQSLLARRREEALAREPDGPGLLGQCSQGRIQADATRLRCAEAYSAAGQPDSAAAALRQAWRTGMSDITAEHAFLQRYGAIPTGADQRARFDRLAWSDTETAARQVARLGVEDRPAAEARLALRRGEAAAPAKLAALPPGARSEPALMLEFARWLRRANQDHDALALWKVEGGVAEHASPPDHLLEFWTERNLLARRLLSQGDAADAYVLAAMHGQTAPATVAEAEFLAGFIALRRLGDAPAALQHFRALAAVSSAAISRARAHYWLGRTLAVLGENARTEYAQAAAFPLTFYGQLAVRALGETQAGLAARIHGLKDPGWTREQALDLAQNELARAAAMLVAWGEPRRAQAFLLRLEETVGSAAERSATARLALGFGLPETAVTVARRMGRDGLELPDAGWPVPWAVPVNPPDEMADPAIILALIRQESSFDMGAASPAGARGLMQLMPATAEAIAKRIGEQTSTIALTTDAAHNMRLGAAYLRSMLEQFGGSLPLAFAAYNAGPNRVLEWLAANGDPRVGQLDALDWIELIPFAETRNYVQRVLENLVIYRAKRGGPALDPLGAG
jgi:soluble lytic murein transglycosylase